MSTSRGSAAGSRRKANKLRGDALQLFPSGGGGVIGLGTIKESNKQDFHIGSSRSSIKHFFDVISTLNEKKKDLVRSVGFGGLLFFPALRQINRKFAVWLMSRVDPLTQTLVIDQNRRLKFNKSDVHRVFAVPCHGRSIFETGGPSREVISQVMRVYLGTDIKENRSIKAAQEVVERDYGISMDEREENAFKVAFVIYAMSTLLSPGSKYDYVSVDYWNALLDPALIDSYDWSEYIIKKLFQAVVKLKSELSASNKVSNIAGCSIFLQVLYLDSIDIGVLNIEHSTFPRIRHFSSETMKSMVLADTICRSSDPNESGFGKSQLRDGSVICYSWGSESFMVRSGTSGYSVTDLWEVASSFSQALGVNMKAAGPIFFAVAEFEGFGNRTQSSNPVNIAAVFAGVIQAFMKGSLYNSGRALDVNLLGAESVFGLNEAHIFACSNWHSTENQLRYMISDGSNHEQTFEVHCCRARKRPRGTLTENTISSDVDARITTSSEYNNSS